MMQCDVMWYGVVSLSSYQPLCSSLNTPVNTSMWYSVYKINGESLYDTVLYSTVRHDTAQYSIA